MEEKQMSIIDSAKVWIFGIAVKKGIVSAAKLIVSFCIAHGIKLIVPVGSVDINTTDEAAMILAINSGLAMFKNWLKIKYPEKFKWL
jgi:hypothetical protein